VTRPHLFLSLINPLLGTRKFNPCVFRKGDQCEFPLLASLHRMSFLFLRLALALNEYSTLLVISVTTAEALSNRLLSRIL
jgi:hypothetical protein